MRNITVPRYGSYEDMLSSIEHLYRNLLPLPECVTVHPCDREQFISIFEQTMPDSTPGFPSLISIPVHFDTGVKQGTIKVKIEDETYEYPLRDSDG